MEQASAGVYEFVFGAPVAERDELLRFWAVLGFDPCDEGTMSADDARQAYGHGEAVRSIRLKHIGCNSFGTGFVRLQFWDSLRNEGLGNTLPMVTGSRWMGMYTHDILQVRDSLTNEQAISDWDLWVSPLVNAPLMKPAPSPSFYKPFVGLRETLIFGKRFRLAFIQRGGFDRPGFGTFNDAIAFKNTEGSHANIVQPDNHFDSAFYKQAFGFETAPFGEPHDSGDEAPTIAALQLRDGELFHVERTRAVDCPTGLLQIYSSYMPGGDQRELSQPGCGNLCAYTVRVRRLEDLRAAVVERKEARALPIVSDEFGQRSMTFYAPDGYAWIALEHVE